MLNIGASKGAMPVTHWWHMGATWVPMGNKPCGLKKRQISKSATQMSDWCNTGVMNICPHK